MSVKQKTEAVVYQDNLGEIRIVLFDGVHKREEILGVFQSPALAKRYAKLVIKRLLVAKEMIGQKYQHTNGNTYTVIHLTNLYAKAEVSKKYPIHVVYMGDNKRVWSRRLSAWERSFKKV